MLVVIQILEKENINKYELLGSGHRTAKQKAVIKTEVIINNKIRSEIEQSIAFFGGPTKVVFKVGKIHEQ